MALRYLALKAFTVGATTYAHLDEVNVTGMSNDTISGLVARGWVGTTMAGNVGSITADATAPTTPTLNDLWVDTSA